MAVTFIRLEKTLEKAMEVFESPISTAFEYRGVQLLPFNELPYVQTTSNPDGIELEDWDVTVHDLCGNELGNITDSFNVDRVFDDALGVAQIDWSITNCPIDFGWQLVYLKISQLAGEDFYTNPFQLTEIDSQFTARFDYKDKESDTMQSVQMQTYFRTKLAQDELTTYYEISTDDTVTKSLKQSTPQKWVAGLFSNELAVKFRNMLNLRYKYVNLSRCNLFEAFEIAEPSARENFGESTYKLVVNDSQKYDPTYVPDPVIPNPAILYMGVTAYKSSSGYRLRFTFTTPSTYTVFQRDFSFVKFNGVTSNIDRYANTVQDPNSVIAVTFWIPDYIVPNEVLLNSLQLRISGPDGQLSLNFLGPVNFTESDILNGITKQITAAINYM